VHTANALSCHSKDLKIWPTHIMTVKGQKKIRKEETEKNTYSHQLLVTFSLTACHRKSNPLGGTPVKHCAIVSSPTQTNKKNTHCLCCQKPSIWI
jgi:hypothetical protein